MNAPSCIPTPKLVRIGNSAGVVLPKEVLNRLGVSIGDTVTASVEEDGSLLLKRSDDAFEAQMTAAREMMARRTRALRELAK